MQPQEKDAKPDGKNQRVYLAIWEEKGPGFSKSSTSPERLFPRFRNSAFYLFLFVLVLFNVAYLFRSLLNFPQPAERSKMCQPASMLIQQQDSAQQDINVIFFGKYAYKNMKIVRGIYRTVHSILQNTKSPLHLHVLLDIPSKRRIDRALKKLIFRFSPKMRVTYYNVDAMARKFQSNIQSIKRNFFNKDVGRYNDDIFFMSEIFHLAFPDTVTKAIFLDLDLKFVADIKELYNEFQKFSGFNLIGIAPDLQPQYRMDFAKFRKANPGTLVGEPRPGKQGFNTGVTLFDFDKMRESDLYNYLLNDTIIERLCEKYYFEGYLGHQDFFTLTGMEFPELYYNLDCSWNRQMDTGWRKNVKAFVFDRYHTCEGNIKVYHGNGNANIPED